MAKKILGLDLGTTSIGWAFIKEAQNTKEQSSIVKIGVRVNPLTTEEQTNFEKGKPISINANRTLRRSARRSLQRYKLRRTNLIEALKAGNVIIEGAILAEDDKYSTHNTYLLRSKSAIEKISKTDFARVLMMINKKRGYKSSRKVKTEENDGQAIDGMDIAKRLYEENLTPGQYVHNLLKENKKNIPDFYRSDLQNEFNRIWNVQKQFHPEILTDSFKIELKGKGQRATSAMFWTTYKFNTAENKGTREERKKKAYEWRSKALDNKLEKEELAYVITDINNNINNSSGYLGEISNRSKELYFNKETIGQYLYKQIQKNPHTRLKNQVFYRQDYLDEFEIIWETQVKFHKELTEELKLEIRDIIIFYQRKLKSQKSLVRFCEFESKETEIEKDNKIITKTIGLKVTPRSSPLFQEIKIWQTLHHLELKNKKSGEFCVLDLETKQLLFNELNTKGNLKKDLIIELLGFQSKDWDLNYSEVEGNRTNQVLYDAYFKIMEIEGHEEIEWQKLSSTEIRTTISSFFDTQNINKKIIDFNSDLEGKAFEQQAAYVLWHILYSYEEDSSTSGNERLYQLLNDKFGFKKEHAKILTNVSFQSDYGNLSAKAIRKILPYLKAGHPYSKKDESEQLASATALAGYNHSSSLTRAESENRILKDELRLLPKNSLRNPIVEKILNQMVNVVNAIIADPNLGKPDEIRIELARELKKNAKEREEMTANINNAKTRNDEVYKILVNDFYIKNPTRNDIIRYKLYQELKFNGYKDLYTNEYIQKEQLFSKKYDIDHIIPQARLFDDSFSNKVLIPRDINIAKGNRTAIDFILERYGEQNQQEYLARIEMLHKENLKNSEEGISKAKFNKLKIKANDIGEGFIERDLRDSQYIARQARSMLQEICMTVMPTTGSITNRLRDDWGLVGVMQELNFDKYKKTGLTEIIEKKDGGHKERIIDWTKRNDHRHHAMDALTIAFTKLSHIQYLNYLNARKNEKHKMHETVIGIEHNETKLIIDHDGNKKRIFKSPLPNFRESAKLHLETILISHKAKNKVVTKNKNRTKNGSGDKIKTELTPRGQLHKETIYSRLKQYVTKEEKVGSKFDEQTIQKVSNAKQRNALLIRLQYYNNNPVEAFTGKNSPSKNPIYLDDARTINIPEKVKLVWLEDDFTIRKSITPTNFKDIKSIEKVIDIGIKRILIKRLQDFNGNEKEAFSNLDKNPIWLNETKGISIKTVAISGVKNAEPLHYKKDHLGNLILDKTTSNPIPVDFVSTGNNHHVAIYRDKNGDLQDTILSFYETVERINQGIPIIDKNYNKSLGWNFLFSMKQNECFIFPSENFDPSEIDLFDPSNNIIISPHLFRVQKLSKLTYGNSAVREYVFRHHLETTVEDKKELKDITFKSIKSLSYLEKIIKVRINHIGQIIKIGEY